MVQIAGSSLSLERLREALVYDETTGVFTRRVTASSNALAGSIVLCRSSKGYLRVMIDGVRFTAHRLAWFYTKGKWPSEQIDHINGIKDDNRIANLREATAGENQQNVKPRRKSTSRFLGVSWHKDRRKWSSQIGINGRAVYLGLFDTEVAAHNAYLAKKRQAHLFWASSAVSALQPSDGSAE